MSADGQQPRAFDVFLRIRPFLPEEQQRGETQVVRADEDGQTLWLTAPVDSHAARSGERQSRCSFTHIFDTESTQSDVFQRTVRPMIDALGRGESSALMAYGVSNSGKTFTMRGEADTERAGLVPRTVAELQRLVTLAKSNASESVFMPQRDKLTLSAIEIYNDTLHDLLADFEIAPAPRDRRARSRSRSRPRIRGTADATSTVRLSTHAGGRVLLEGAKKVPLDDADLVRRALAFAQQRRRTAQTALNSGSSRGHMVLCVSLRRFLGTSTGRRQDVSSFQTAQLLLVDLAGIERRRTLEAAAARCDNTPTPAAEEVPQVKSEEEHAALVARVRERSQSKFRKSVVRKGSVSGSSVADIVALNSASSSASAASSASSSSKTPTKPIKKRAVTRRSSQQETGGINASLMHLGHCLRTAAAGHGRRASLQTRRCQLTRLLGGLLGGEHGRAAMLVCVYPGGADYDEKLHALGYAGVARQITLRAEQKRVLLEAAPEASKPAEKTPRGRRIIDKVASKFRAATPSRAASRNPNTPAAESRLRSRSRSRGRSRVREVLKQAAPAAPTALGKRSARPRALSASSRPGEKESTSDLAAQLKRRKLQIDQLQSRVSTHQQELRKLRIQMQKAQEEALRERSDLVQKLMTAQEQLTSQRRLVRELRQQQQRSRSQSKSEQLKKPEKAAESPKTKKMTPMEWTRYFYETFEVGEQEDAWELLQSGATRMLDDEIDLESDGEQEQEQEGDTTREWNSDDKENVSTPTVDTDESACEERFSVHSLATYKPEKGSNGHMRSDTMSSTASSSESSMIRIVPPKVQSAN